MRSFSHWSVILNFPRRTNASESSWADFHLPPRPPSNNGRHYVFAALAMILIGVAIRYTPSKATYTTAIGERRSVELAPGMHLSLNTDSRVVVTASPSHIKVELQKGEILCDVGSHGSPQLEVGVDGLLIVDVGTIFSVRKSSGGGAEILVAEGEVRVSGPRAVGLSLSKGYRAAVDLAVRHPVVDSISPVEIRRELAWQSGRVEFHGQNLVTAVAEINRYNRIRIEVGEEIENLPLGGSFDPTNAEWFVSRVLALYPEIHREVGTDPDGTTVWTLRKTAGAPTPQPPPYELNSTR